MNTDASRFRLGSGALIRYLGGTIFVLWLSATSLLGDGCFVFRWNKAVDINEPTQKAILVYNQGHEDLLLQVKYEGPLQDFGWLIAVPALPTVTQGSMKAFYELSQLTQRRFGAAYGAIASRGGTDSAMPDVRVISVKTVGAYQVAILSAKDSGSLSGWLDANGYVVPNHSNDVLEEYLRKAWYFVAVKIHLDGTTSFKMVSNSAPVDKEPETPGIQKLRQELSSGELHPLLISFDTEQCIFPLKISAVARKPSEVSLYVMSKEPLVSEFILNQKLAKLRREKLESDRKAPERQERGRESLRNVRRLGLAWQMYSLLPPSEGDPRKPRGWSLEDLDTIAAESDPPAAKTQFDDDDYPNSAELMQNMEVTADKLVECAKVFKKLRGESWHLTKQVYTFRPEEMQDLIFQSAVPLLTAALKLPEGRFAAGPLYQCGLAVLPFIRSACTSTNSTERINGSSLLQSYKNPSLVELLLSLLRDPLPRVRLNALMAMPANWDDRFVGPLFDLLRDPESRISWQAAQWLSLHEAPERAPKYLVILRDSDPDIAARGLQVLMKINPDAIPRGDLLRLLGTPNLDVLSGSLQLLEGTQSVLPKQPPTAGLISQSNGSQPPDLSSLEAAPLITNHLTLARLAGLRILYRRGDSDAVTLAIPLLRDGNTLVRNRAFGLLHSKTGQDFAQDDPTAWEEWWSENKAHFNPH